MSIETIGAAVRRRRETLGLSRRRLATLAELPGEMLETLERGALPAQDTTRVSFLLQLLGLDPDSGEPRARRGLLPASRAASVSYRSSLDDEALAQALSSGQMPPEWMPHLATLIDEVPLSLIVAAVEETAARTGTSPSNVWRNVLRWAGEIRSPRKAWR